MKNILSIFVFLLIFSFSLFSQISEKEIITVADNFIKSEKIFKGFSTDSKTEIKELHYNNTLLAYVVQLQPQGFIIITSSKNTYPIFGYSNEANLDTENADPKALNILLSLLSEENKITNNQQINNADLIKKNNIAWNNILTKSNSQKDDFQYGYWMNDVWGGVNCYDDNGQVVYAGNYFTPNHYSPGCVATSLSQVLHYYNWPPRGLNTHTDNDNSGSSQGNYYAKFANTEYDWANMLDRYYNQPSNDDQQRAISLLAYHCGVAVDMNYENAGSTSNVDRVPNALSSYFRFVGHYEGYPSWNLYISRLQDNLENAHPVIIAGRADNGDEHAFVCDGYKYNTGEDKYYHLNMGWWNAYGLNGWYRIFNNFNVGGYNTIFAGIFDIIPKPYIGKPIYTNNPQEFYVTWSMPSNVDATFEIEESFDNGTWTTIASAVTDTFLLRTVTTDGLYKYRVLATVDGIAYANSYSGYMNVPVGESTYLNFDGDDSFFIYDNSYNNLDVDTAWTFEAWVNADTYTTNGWNVIMDRQTVFSMYLLDDADADFAVRFVARDASGNIIASLNSETSSVNLELGQWFHVAASFDGTTARLFLNGNIVDEIDDANFILSSSTNAFNVGARYWGSYSRYLDGKLDEIRISDIARYTENFCPSRFTSFSDDENTRLLLHLDDYSGTTIYDETHNFLGVTYRASPNDPNWAKSSTPIILKNALSQSLCSGDAQFDITSYNNTTSQWQLSTTGNFTDLSDGGVYSGSTTNNLNISDISSLSGQLFYRCIIKSSDAFACSENAYLNVLDNCTVWNGTTWSNGEPNNSLSAIIDANYSTSSNLDAANIVVNKNDTLFIMPDNTFSTDYIENNGVIVLKADFGSDFTGALITNNILNYGEMIAEKLISAPNLEQEYNQNIINSPLNSAFPFNQIWSYNLIFLQNNSSPNSWTEANYDGNMTFSQAYLVQAISPEIIQFKGTFNTGEINFPLEQGWNLIYNPYPSPIDWNNESGWNKQGISDDIYFLDPNNNGNSQNLSTYNGLVNTFSANQYINSMQGFFIYATDENAILTINDNAKVKNSDVQENNYSLNNILKFEFENSENETDEAIIYFSDNDNDSYKIEPLRETKTYTYVLSNPEKYGIASIIQETPDTTITVGFKSSTAGTCTFRVTDFDFSVPVILKDLLTGDTTTLELGTEYQFSASTNEPVNRFKIYFGNYTTNISEIENSIEIYSDGNTLNIFSNSPSTINIYNVLGQTVLSTKFKNFKQINNLKTGIYIVEIFNKNEYKTQKIIINN